MGANRATGPGPSRVRPPGPTAPARAAAGLLVGILWVLLPHLTGTVPPLAGQEAGSPATAGRVLSARFEARVPEAEPDASSTEVTIRYRLVADTTVRRVPVKGMAFFEVTPADVRAQAGGQRAPIGLEVKRGPLLAGGVDLPTALAPGDSLKLILTYRLPAAIPTTGGRFDVVLPLLFVDWKPAGAPEGLLEAAIELPAKYSIQESFPTVPRTITTQRGVRRYDLQLQAVPSLIRFRGHAGEPPFFTFSRLVDLGVLALLGVVGAWGWLALRRQRARAEAERREAAE